MSNEIPQTQTPQGSETSVQQLTSLVDRMEKANVEKARLLEEERQIIAKRLIGGETLAGKQPVPVPVETPQEYAKRISLGKVI